jgi:mannose-6-phosphate isomerase-like protein (cupin superfamily)
MLFGTVEAFSNCFEEHDPKTWEYCWKAVRKGKYNYNNNKSVSEVSKKIFKKINSRSFDYAVLEKYNYVKGIKLDIDWTDLGNWFEILKIFNKKKTKYFKKKNLFKRPWGHYVNLYRGKGFLIKELFVKPKGILSLQKHYHRSEHWLITQGIAKVTLDKKTFLMHQNEKIFIPLGSIHRIQNNYKKPLKIIEAQVGSILKETDIVRFQDIYGRVK